MAVVWVFAIILFVAGGVYGVKSNAKTKEMFTEGRIIAREDLFWENGEYLYTTTPYETILEAVMQEDFTECRVSVTPNYEDGTIIAFVDKRSFSAALACYGEENGEHIYEICFPSWNEKGLVSVSVRMNLLMTKLEKIFLSFDPDTEAEIQILDTKTRTSFW